MYILLILTTLVVVSTIAAGVIVRYKEMRTGFVKPKSILKVSLSTFIPILAAAVIMFVPQIAHAAEAGAATADGSGFIAAAITTAVATIAAGYAVGAVGSAALGAVSENPKILGSTLIYVGMAEGIAIYGLIISIMILGKF